MSFPVFGTGGKWAPPQNQIHALVDVDRILQLPPIVLVPVPLFAALVLFYKVIAPKFETEKQKAYVLSALSSFVMTASSVPFVAAYLAGGFERVWSMGNNGWGKVFSDYIIAFFATYLFADLVVGFFAYRKQVGLLTGWVHHIAYIGIMVHCATSKQSCVFNTAAIMELPTFDLAISTLFPAVRSDERFLSLMVILRIAFNAWLLVDAARPSTRHLTEDSWIPTFTLALALVLHTSWMHAGIVGYLKRRSKARAAAKAAAAEARSITTETDYLTKEVSSKHTPPFLDISDVRTPDESPLVTPFTPSEGSEPRFFSNVAIDQMFPTLHMPAMPNLPIPAIPTLSGLADALPQAKANLNQLRFEFKEAVHARLEEQRERLAQRGFLRRRNVYVDDGDLSE